MQVQNGKPVGKSEEIKVNLDENNRKRKRGRGRDFLSYRGRQEGRQTLWFMDWQNIRRAKLVLGKLTETKEQKRNEAGKRSE